MNRFNCNLNKRKLSTLESRKEEIIQNHTTVGKNKYKREVRIHRLRREGKYMFNWSLIEREDKNTEAGTGTKLKK